LKTDLAQLTKAEAIFSEIKKMVAYTLK
jgi:hypothetical protein